MKPNEPLRGVARIRLDLTVWHEETGKSTKISFLIPSEDLAASTASSVGSGLQRMVYEMLQNAVDSLDT